MNAAFFSGSLSEPFTEGNRESPENVCHEALLRVNLAVIAHADITNGEDGLLLPAKWLGWVRCSGIA